MTPIEGTNLVSVTHDEHKQIHGATLSELRNELQALRERVEKLENEKMSIKISERQWGGAVIVQRIPVDRGVSAE